MILFFLFVIIVLSIGHFYWSRRHLYAAASQYKGPRGWPLIGNAFSFWGGPDKFLQQIVSIFGGTDEEPLRIWLGPYLVIGFRKPAHIEKILASQKFAYKPFLYRILEKIIGSGLITATGGPNYRKHKRIIQPFLDLKFIESSLDIIQENLHLCLEKMEVHADKDMFDVEEYIMKCCFDFVGEIMLGKKINSQKNGLTKFCEACIDMYEVTLSRTRRIWEHPDFIYKLLHRDNQYNRIYNDLHTFPQEALTDSWARRKLMNNDINKFVPIIDRLTEHIERKPDDMNEEDIINHLLTLIQASQDPLAIASSFAVLCFGMYPEYQEKAIDELRNIIGEIPRKITLEDTYKMEYLDMCIKEVLRIFPIGAEILRDIREDITIEKWTAPRGATLVIPIFTLHRNQKYWENPNHFYPDHFLPEQVRERPVFAYLPFSAGPRGCIGKRLAMAGLKVIIANILLRYEIEAAGKVPDLELKVDISIRPKKGYYCKIRRRHLRK